MTTHKEALKLALEALVGLNMPMGIWQAESRNKAITAIKEALAQPEQVCRDDGRCQYAIDSGAEGMGHCPKGKCVMPRPEQEPVAWMHWLRGPVRVFLNKDEAMMELERLNRDYASDKDARMMRPLVFGDTTPPQRKPLTDEQKEQIHQQYGGDIKKIMCAVEAAHGIKGEE